jgi:hypothetical protein
MIERVNWKVDFGPLNRKLIQNVNWTIIERVNWKVDSDPSKSKVDSENINWTLIEDRQLNVDSDPSFESWFRTSIEVNWDPHLKRIETVNQTFIWTGPVNWGRLKPSVSLNWRGESMPIYQIFNWRCLFRWYGYSRWWEFVAAWSIRVRLIRAEPQVLKFTLIEAVNLTPLIWRGLVNWGLIDTDGSESQSLPLSHWVGTRQLRQIENLQSSQPLQLRGPRPIEGWLRPSI